MNRREFIASCAAAASAAPAPAEAVRMCVLRGDADRITGAIDGALASGLTPEALLNEVLIPAITEVGRNYEEKKFFLPQLISGAEAMSRGTAYLDGAAEPLAPGQCHFCPEGHEHMLVNDGTEVGIGSKIPLWLFGFLY